MRRTVGEVATLLADRERRFGAHGIDSVATFRRLRRPSDLDATLAVPEDGFGDVFLVVDGWATLRSEYEDLEPVLVDVATRGLSYGIHLVATATRWFDFRPASRTCSAPGSSCGSATRPTRWSTARPPPTCRPARPGAGSSPTGCSCSPRCRRSPATRRPL